VRAGAWLTFSAIEATGVLVAAPMSATTWDTSSVIGAIGVLVGILAAVLGMVMNIQRRLSMIEGFIQGHCDRMKRGGKP
jgi:hypothetical protein